MSNEKLTLSRLFAEQIFVVPAYQRGYAWRDKQVTDLIKDIDALIEDDSVRYHYTGTIVTFDTRDTAVYKKQKLRVMDVVDGQQRMTSIILYLAILLNRLAEKDSEYAEYISNYLYDRETPRLRLFGDSGVFFLELLKSGGKQTGRLSKPQTPSQTNLLAAAGLFNRHLDKCDFDRLEQIFQTIISKMVFTSYSIEEECEIGMTFELMNSRGKDLTNLELLKNYLMYWAFRNAEPNDRKNLTNAINRNWASVYASLGKLHGSDDQCLRIAWILYCHYLPKYWHGYDGFKDDDVFPIRNFSKKSKAATREFIDLFIDGLAEISAHYAILTKPTPDSCCTSDELDWLLNIHHTGNIANFLPLMVVCRIQMSQNKITGDQYVNMLKHIECFAYRVFLWERKRSNAGKSNFYRWAMELFKEERSIDVYFRVINELTEYYSPQADFEKSVGQPQDWYAIRNTLKYTLYEYEKHLLDVNHKNVPRITWEDLAYDSTLEHVLPQTLDSANPSSAQWSIDWKPSEIALWRNDIGNMTLTRDNSRYRNFNFSRKRDGKNNCGQGCYADSDIRQERDLRHFKTWNALATNERHDGIVSWITKRWKVEVATDTPIEIDEEQDNDAPISENIHLETEFLRE